MAFIKNRLKNRP